MNIRIYSFPMLPFLIFFLILLSAYPVVFTQFLPIPHINLVGILCLFWLGTTISLKRKVITFPFIVNFVYFFQCVCWLFYFVYHNDTSYITRIVFLSIAYMFLFYANNNKRGIFSIIKIFNNFILILAIGGTISFFLVLFGFLEPLFTFQNVDEREAYYFGLTFSNVYIGNIIRYSGIFDEPGAMAFWGVFALLLNRLFVGDKRYEKILAICLLFTFSVAYYIQLFLFILFSKNKIKSIFYVFFVITILASGIYQTKDTEFDLYSLSLKRFELDSNGNMLGDNRSDLSIKAKKQFLKAPLLGVGATNFASMEYMSDNPYEILAKDGIIGEFITYIPLFLLIYYSRVYKCSSYLVAFIILFVGYQQRPFHVDFWHPLLLYLLVFMAILKTNFRYETKDISSDCNI